MAEFHLLPPALAALAPLCAKECGRYSMQGVLVEAAPDGAVTAVGSDGYVMGVVTLPPNPERDGKYRPAARLAAAPNSGVKAVIPTDAYRAAFKAIPKHKRTHPVPTEQQALAVKIGAPAERVPATEEAPEVPARPAVVALSTSDGKGAETFAAAESVEGRYPDWRQVFPAGPAFFRVAFQPSHLRRVLDAAESFADPLCPVVVLTFRGATAKQAAETPAEVTAHAAPFAFRGLAVPTAAQGMEQAPDSVMKNRNDQLYRALEHAHQCIKVLQANGKDAIGPDVLADIREALGYPPPESPAS